MLNSELRALSNSNNPLFLGTTEPVDGYITVPALLKEVDKNPKKRKKKAPAPASPVPGLAPGFMSLDSGSEAENAAGAAPPPRKVRHMGL